MPKETAEEMYEETPVDSSIWSEAEAHTGRPNDIPIEDPDRELPDVLKNDTFAKRSDAAAKQAKTKKVDDAENKAVQTTEKKAPAKRARKSRR